MQKLLITLFNKIRVPQAGSKRNTSLLVNASAFNRELATQGYTLDGDTLKLLDRLSASDFAKLREDVLSTVTELSGSTAKHNVLFNKFPYETPDQSDYLARRIYGYMQTVERHNVENATILSCGHLIDPRLFNLEYFGACPICQNQVDELASPEEVRDEFKSVTPYKVLSAASDEYLTAQANKMLGRNSSLSKDEREFLRLAADEFTLSAPETVFNENLPYVYGLVDDVSGLCKGATDVMRIAYYLSNPDSDLSLKENVKFKVSTRDKKKLLKLLDGMKNLEEDMMRNRERWLRLGERLNPTSKVNGRRFPKAAQAFSTLRNSSKTIPTFNRVVEQGVRAKNIDHTFINKLAQRPGEFLRKLDFILRTADANGLNYALKVLEADVLPKARTKMITEVMKYFDFRVSGKQTSRLFLPKGQVNKMQIVEDKREPVDAKAAAEVGLLMQTELLKRFKTDEPLGKVYLDDSLKGLVLPYNKRGDSSATTSVSKGSRYPINEDAKVLRLFVHWTGRDVDLSATFFDAEFEKQQSVAYTNLKMGSIKHSGDITYAPNGGSEFIDMEIDEIAKLGFRYVALSLISFSGEKFNTFPCFAGFMERDAVASGARFEPESVVFKFDVNSPNTSHLPLVFDIETREVIYLDVASGAGRYGAVARGAGDKFREQTKAALLLPEQKPTAFDVLFLKATANGEIVDNADDADITFSRENVNVEELAEELAV